MGVCKSIMRNRKIRENRVYFKEYLYFCMAPSVCGIASLRMKDHGAELKTSLRNNNTALI